MNHFAGDEDDKPAPRPEPQPQPVQEARAIQWIASICAALLVTVGGFWLTYMSNQVESLRVENKIEAREAGDIRERLRGVETKLADVDDTTKATRGDVQKIRESLEAARTHSGTWSGNNGIKGFDGR